MARNRQSATQGFTPDEHEALMPAIVGTSDQNAPRLVDELSATGIVSGALSSRAGYQMGGPIGAVVTPAADYTARKGAEYIQQGFVDELMDIIVAGCSKAAIQVSPNRLQSVIDANRDDLAKTLNAGAQYQESR